MGSGWPLPVGPSRVSCPGSAECLRTASTIIIIIVITAVVWPLQEG